jgi:hypothetical protein
MKKPIYFIFIIICVFNSYGRKLESTTVSPKIKNEQFQIQTIPNDEKVEEAIDNIRKEESSEIIIENENFDFCDQIIGIYDKIVSYEYFDDFDINIYDELRVQLFELIIVYLKTEESLNVDNIKKLSFVNISISDDEKIRIYDFLIGNNDYTYYTFIQYITDSGELIALRSDQLNLQLYARMKYDAIYNLDKNKYIFCAYTQWGRTMSVRLNTMELKNGMLIPYMAFNGNYIFDYLSDPGMRDSRIYSLDCIFNKNPFKIKIVFDVHEDRENYSEWVKNKSDPEIQFARYYIYDILEFDFNGSEYIGDYEKFMEIKKWRPVN